MKHSQKSVRPVFWIVAAVTILVALTIMADLGPGPQYLERLVSVLIFVAAAGDCTLLFLSIGLAVSGRRRRAAMILNYLEQSVRLNLPLPKILRAAREGETGRSAWRLRLLQQHVEDGMPLGHALEASVPEMSARTIGILTAAERIGQLPRALARLRKEQRRSPRRDSVNITFYRIYPVMMLMVCAATLTLISVFVLPKLAAIFHDYGETLPAITLRTFTCAFAAAPWILVLMAVVLLGAAFGTIWLFAYPLYHRQMIWRGAFDQVIWRIPVLHALERDRGLADAFAFVADAVEAELPLHVALTEASSLHINEVLRKRLLLWRSETAQGAPIHEATHKALLPALAVGMLGSMTRREDAAGVFQFLRALLSQQVQPTGRRHPGVDCPGNGSVLWIARRRDRAQPVRADDNTRSDYCNQDRPMNKAPRHRAFLLAEVIVAIALVGIVVTLLSVSLHQKTVNSQRLEDSRRATSLAEQTLTALQTGATRPEAPHGAMVVVKQLDTPTSVGRLAWAEVQVQLNGREARIIGVVRAGALQKGGAK